MDDTIILKCPKCGHFIAEFSGFFRGRHCGYEIIISDQRPDALTNRQATPKLAATTA